MPAPPIVVLIPVKAFDRAKSRLASSLDPAQRARLARAMATAVASAAAPLPVTVVCDDDDVARWAESVGASVELTPGVGLNGAVAEAVERLRVRGVARVVVAHGDLPFARSFEHFLDGAGSDEIVVVPDRRRHGTNVLSVPTDAGFRFAYGSGSLDRHLAEAERLGHPVRVLTLDDLGWDIDEPEDLLVPEHLGSLDTTAIDPPTDPDGAADDPAPADPTDTRSNR